MDLFIVGQLADKTTGIGCGHRFVRSGFKRPDPRKVRWQPGRFVDKLPAVDVGPPRSSLARPLSGCGWRLDLRVSGVVADRFHLARPPIVDCPVKSDNESCQSGVSPLGKSAILARRSFA